MTTMFLEVSFDYVHVPTCTWRSYTSGPIFDDKTVSRGSGFGALADVEGFGTEALMREKEVEKRKEEKW